MIAIVIALVVLIFLVICIATHLGNGIKENRETLSCLNSDFLGNKFDFERREDNLKNEIRTGRESWIRKYGIDFSHVNSRIDKCEELFKEIQEDTRIRAMLKKFPILNEELLRDAVNDITHKDFKESDIESIAEYLYKTVEPFLPNIKPAKKTE